MRGGNASIARQKIRYLVTLNEFFNVGGDTFSPAK